MLIIIKHYRSEPHKKGKSCVYAFRAIDLETGMYVAFGYPNRSEMEAFRRALKMLKDVEIDSMAPGRYYSSRSIRLFGKRTHVYVIPENNICGTKWTKVLKMIVESPAEFLKSYFKRNLSHFSSDKRRFGWRIRQRREDRKEQALFSIAAQHFLCQEGYGLILSQSPEFAKSIIRSISLQPYLRTYLCIGEVGLRKDCSMQQT